MFCSYRISTDKLSRGPSAIAEPLVTSMFLWQTCYVLRLSDHAVQQVTVNVGVEQLSAAALDAVCHDGHELKFHGSSFLVASSSTRPTRRHPREDVTRMLRGNCFRGIPAILLERSTSSLEWRERRLSRLRSDRSDRSQFFKLTNHLSVTLAYHARPP